jgi:hypothetical protein
MTLLDEGKSYEAREAFEVISQNEDPPIALMAHMWLIKLKHMAGKEEEAANMAKKVRETFASHSEFSAYLDWLSLYEPFSDDTTSSSDSVFRMSLLETQAVKHLKAKELKQAAVLYQTIADDSHTPATMRERADLLLSTILRPFIPKQSPNAAN